MICDHADEHSSDEARQHAIEVLEASGYTVERPSTSTEDEHEVRVLAGYKAALNSMLLSISHMLIAYHLNLQTLTYQKRRRSMHERYSQSMALYEGNISTVIPHGNIIVLLIFCNSHHVLLIFGDLQGKANEQRNMPISQCSHTFVKQNSLCTHSNPHRTTYNSIQSNRAE